MPAPMAPMRVFLHFAKPNSVMSASLRCTHSLFGKRPMRKRHWNSRCSRTVRFPKSCSSWKRKALCSRTSSDGGWRWRWGWGRNLGNGNGTKKNPTEGKQLKQLGLHISGNFCSSTYQLTNNPTEILPKPTKQLREKPWSNQPVRTDSQPHKPPGLWEGFAIDHNIRTWLCKARAFTKVSSIVNDERKASLKIKKIHPISWAHLYHSQGKNEINLIQLDSELLY